MSELEPNEPRILARAEHSISRKNISREALKVLYRLADGGHRAYLVGGSVRDLMLGREPKDFDVATDARPNEVRRLFRNARVIGRRFRLAHVIFRDEIVEVSTFRREPDPAEQRSDDPDDLLITSDNTFGSPDEDARRRDFTVNALFYSISDFSVIDYVGGVADLERRTIRTIGDPLVRFREDPVRMMRACELAGRLGFGIDAASQAAMQELSSEIGRAAPPRLTEELIELLRCGRAGAALQWMLDLGLLSTLLPEAYAMIAASERGLGDFGRMLPTLDRKASAGREIGEGALLASLLLPSVLLRRFDVEAVSQRALRRAELRALTEEVVAPFFERFALSKERARRTTEALAGFHRLCERRSATERVRVAGAAWFPDALWLFELLADSTGEGHEELAQWQAAARRRPVLAAPGEGAKSESAREDGKPQPARRRRRRRRRR
ncbi:MAG: polynucleotide adenylyltransferase PcnB [Acidobacteria bacterium]|nr:polynucleotide adenylyltransferase PcnB [Acidobacteriota bacterium]MCB9377150.1 polynucleotide adenylyltransferase PcnB [Holophagales bacterium]